MWSAAFWFAAAAGFLLDAYVGASAGAYTVSNATQGALLPLFEVYDCGESLVAAFGSHLEAVAYVRDALLRGRGL